MFWILFMSFIGWNYHVRFLPSLGTIAWAGSQAICWCSSVMDGCIITLLLQTKQLCNQVSACATKSSFYLASFSHTRIDIHQLSSFFSFFFLGGRGYQSLLEWLSCSSWRQGPLSVIKDVSPHQQMFSYPLSEHLQDQETNTFFSRPFAALPLTSFYTPPPPSFLLIPLLPFSR